MSSSIDSSIEEGVRVLHLDPDRNAYETLSGFLTYWFGDYVSVRWTSSVEEAIEELNSDRIDVLITEVVLPGQGDPTVFVDRLMDEPGAADRGGVHKGHRGYRACGRQGCLRG